jgi:hypothetical protein
MTDDELRRLAQAWAERTAIQRGLPVKIDNPVILEASRTSSWPQDKKPDQA